MFSRKKTEFEKALEIIMNTPEGMMVLKYLQTIYVDTTSLHSDALTTGFHLGQKELVLGLMKALRDVRQLDDLKLTHTEQGNQHDRRNAFGE